MIGNPSNTRERLMRQLQAYDFALYDTILYLDAYPDSKEALSAYNKYSRLAKRAREEYESRFGPLTPPLQADAWNISNGPWPWQETRGDK